MRLFFLVFNALLASYLTSAARVAPAAAPCSVVVNNQAQSFDACYTVPGVGSNFQVAMTLAPDPSDSTSSLLTMALSAASAGYVAVGFPRRPGVMVGASSMILQACSTCPSGASIQEYYLGGEHAKDVVVDTRLNPASTSASARGGQLAGSFQMKVPAAANAVAGPAAFPMIYAAGDLTAAAGLKQHYAEGDNVAEMAAAGVADTGGAGAAAAADGGSSSSVERAKTWHMWLMAVSWGVLIPTGILMARSLRPHTVSAWFHIHRAIQSLGFTLGLVGLVLGFVANEGWATDLPVHRNLGMAVAVLGVVQVTALLVRPDPGTKYRRPGGLYHRWAGRTTAVLAIANIYYGIINVEELGTWAWATYTGVLAAIMLAAVGVEAHEYVRRRRGVEDQPSKGDASESNSVSYAHAQGDAFITSTQTGANGAPNGVGSTSAV